MPSDAVDPLQSEPGAVAERRERAPEFVRAAIVFTTYAAAIQVAAWMSLRFGASEQRMLLVFGLCALPLTGISVWLGRPGGVAMVQALGKQMRRWPLWLFCGALLIVLLLIARFGFDGFPSAGDEQAYVFQAETYARGRLWVDPPAVSEAFQFSQLFVKDGRWFSWYQPGWPLFMTPVVLLGGPLWIVNPLLGAMTAAAFFALARQTLERPAAWLATVALMASPFFLFNYASYFPHGAAALSAILFVLAGEAYLRSGRWPQALAAGVCIGLLGFIRAFNAPMIAAPFVLWLLLTPRRRSGLLWFAAGGAPFLAVLLAYFAAFSGNPLLPVQEWIRPGREPVGAPSHVSLRETALRIGRLVFWTSPVALIGWSAAIAAFAKRRQLRFADLIFPATVVGFIFYGGHGGWQYGPRYLFEAWPFAVLTAMRALQPLLFSPSAEPGTAARAAPLAAAALLAHLAYQLAYSPPRLALQHRFVTERQQLYRDAEALQLRNAVVFIRGPAPGVREVYDVDLTRNALDPASASIIYVLDRGAANAAVLAAYPGRTAYLYEKGRLRPAGS